MPTPFAERPSPFMLACAVALAAGQMVKVSASETVGLTGAGDGATMLGVVVDDLTADDITAGRKAVIQDRKKPGLVQLIAANPIAAGVAIYCAATGYADDVVSGLKIGTSVTAAAAAGDVFWAHLNADQQ